MLRSRVQAVHFHAMLDAFTPQVEFLKIFTKNIKRILGTFFCMHYLNTVVNWL